MREISEDNSDLEDEMLTDKETVDIQNFTIYSFIIDL